jgi:hypothetical protein
LCFSVCLTLFSMPSMVSAGNMGDHQAIA